MVNRCGCSRIDVTPSGNARIDIGTRRAASFNVDTGDVTQAINRHNLDEHSHPYILGKLSEKQDKITDLESIRAGSRAGLTALQPGDNVSELNNDANYINIIEMYSAISDHNTSEEAHSYIRGLISAEETRAEGVEGELSSLTTTEKGSLVGAINEVNARLGDEIVRATGVEGSLSGLTTDSKNNLVSAINEVDSHADTNASSIGTLSSLNTDAKTNLVSAINEVDSHSDTNSSNIGTLSSLTTEAKTNLVSAINEVDSHADTNASNIGTLSNLTTDSKTNLVSAINEVDSHADTNASNISIINGKIPSDASSSNQLADKEFVNSSIATSTANFIGTFNSVSELNAYSGTVTNNDYAFVINGIVTDNGNDWATFADLDEYDKTLLTNFDYAWVINGSNFDLYRFDIVEQDWVSRATNITKESVTLNSAYNRYKASVTTATPPVVTWLYEYTLNNSSFTATQWAAINSGATSSLITQISTNETAIGTLSSLTTSNKTDLVSAVNELNSDKVEANTAITGATKCKITYDSKGLVTAGADLQASDIPSLTLSKISDVTASASEVNVLDGITATTTELNILDGVTATATEINVLDGITASTTELNYVDGVTSSIQTQINDKVTKNNDITGATKCKITYDAKGLVTSGADLQASDIPSLTLSKISDVTATASEVNVLDGITASTTELNYVDGVTSAIQTQLNGKQPNLESGTNIKTINSNSILGSGNLTPDNLVPSQSGNSGKYLTTNGTNVSWGTVDALPSQTGQSGKYLTTNGTTASWASVDALPSQTGQSGKYLTTNGTTASWSTVSQMTATYDSVNERITFA